MSSKPKVRSGVPKARAAFVVAIATLAFLLALLLQRYSNVWLTTGVAAAVSLALVARFCPKLLRTSGASPKHILVGFVAGILMMAATHLAYRLVVPVVPVEEAVGLLYKSMRTPPGPVLGLPVLCFVVFVEEIVWRGVLYERLSKRYAALPAIVVASLIYAIPQIASLTHLIMLVAFCCGLVWTWLRAYSGGWLAPLICHLIWDLGILIVFPLVP